MSTATDQRLELRAAYTATAVWLAVAAAEDVWLVRTKRAPITAVLRTPAGLAFLGVLNLHVLNVLGVFDPFRWAARMIRPDPAPQ